ncbi:Hypothetical_protein [Hexamita inflata]|uniref:Hypothetical_protein n=1 Tax=Hexamita inflata TaxID=28002 RepID=A0AA86N5S8_9EUKA|nr:Hypothetical protein HINF_LOCUS935 [Hexamita inflata]CAI9913293.1 Hypothetical protein HINF_LOCUS938 [Hexamita inflata]
MYVRDFSNVFSFSNALQRLSQFSNAYWLLKYRIDFRQTLFIYDLCHTNRTNIKIEIQNTCISISLITILPNSQFSSFFIFISVEEVGLIFDMTVNNKSQQW